MDDLRDQLERMLGAQPKTDERDVGVLPRSHRTDLLTSISRAITS